MPQLAQGLAALMTVLFATPPAVRSASPGIKVHIEQDGVYRVRHEDLASAGLRDRRPSAGLGLTVAGKPVPVWVEDGGDGDFGPGDWIEFVGEHLQGQYSYTSEFTRYNVYVLRFDHVRPVRMTSTPHPEPTLRGASQTYRNRRHDEEDLLILRLPPTPDARPEELWYWEKLVHNRRQPFVHRLELDDLDPRSGFTVDLRIQLRAWSRPVNKADPAIADHQVDVSLNGEAVTSAAWNGTRPYLLEIRSLPAHRFRRGENDLEIKVARRPSGEVGRDLIDVVLLNWIEVDYPRDRWVGDRQTRFLPEGSAAVSSLHLVSEPGRAFVVYGDGGTRTPSNAMARAQVGDVETFVFRPAPGERRFFAARPEALHAPEAVTLDRPSRLADTGNRADYIMIAHETLVEAVRPLAEHHRSQGLQVAVVDVEDVYDEFSHGVVDPEALRNFLHHAYHHWRRPAPRYVLLVGDASWDGKNRLANDANYADWTYQPAETRDFVKNTSTPYPEDADVNHRGLVPTWNHTTHQGHSASDNYFVAVDGDDFLPDMAIGRFPVVTPAEVAQIVAKTVRYASEPEAGAWRRNALFVTNESRRLQHQSNRLADLVRNLGYAPEKIYPASTETSNEHHTLRLVESLNRGQLIVHFIGHGGRYIWRTGPPDLEKNHDLFTLDNLDQLKPTDRLPVVLSLTCFSAPFDHPSADSIGEKLLRLDERGAVAVFAASWRNSPRSSWGQILLEELTRPGVAVGDGIVEAKRRIQQRILVETYNLLGDPAIPVAAPPRELGN